MNGYLPTVILHNSNLDLPFRCLQALIQNISVGCSYVGSGNCECKPSTSHVKLTLKSISASPGLPSCPTLQWFHPDPIAMAPYALPCFLHRVFDHFRFGRSRSSNVRASALIAPALTTTVLAPLARGGTTFDGECYLSPVPNLPPYESQLPVNTTFAAAIPIRPTESPQYSRIIQRP